MVTHKFKYAKETMNWINDAEHDWNPPDFQDWVTEKLLVLVFYFKN